MSEQITWEDEYPVKNPRELISYATCIVDGYKWRVDEKGKTYCAGRKEQK